MPFLFSSQKTPDIAPVLQYQGAAIVFGVALEKHELATALLLCEHIGPRDRRGDENAVSACFKLA